MRTTRRSEQRQPITIRNEPVAWRTKGEVSVMRKRNAERTPIKATLQQSEAARVDVSEDPDGFQRREVEGQPLDLRGLGANACSSGCCSQVDRTRNCLVSHVERN